MPFSALAPEPRTWLLAAHSWDGAVRLLAWVEIVIADPPEPRNVIQDGRWAMGFTHPKLTAVNVATGFLVPGKEGTAALVFPPRRAIEWRAVYSFLCMLMPTRRCDYDSIKRWTRPRCWSFAPALAHET